MPAATLLAAARDLSRDLAGLRFAAPVALVYDPLTYAWALHEAYITRFAHRGIDALFLGMNPGPWGMAQTGVPFGEVPAVRDWMGLAGAVGKPTREHPKRPIEGLACARSEVSGRRLWGLFAERFTSADAFFARHFVANYCPLVFMAASGANLTPDKLPADERAPLEAACDRHLAAVVAALAPQRVIGVGGFAAERARTALAVHGQSAVPVAQILHPSPASPAANRGWAEQAERQLVALGVWNARATRG